MSNVRRWVGFPIVVFLSLVLPGLVALLGLGYFALTSMDRYNSPVFKGGEIWYTEYSSFSPLLFDDIPNSCELRRRNLTTGVEQSTGIQLKDDYATPMWIGDDLYLISSTAVYVCTAAQIRTNAIQTPQFVTSVLPHPGSTFDSTFFAYHGELTTLGEDKLGECILLHLRDRKWVAGEKVRLPPPNCRWTKSRDGRNLIIPSTLSTSSTAVGISVPAGFSVATPPTLTDAAIQLGSAVMTGDTSVAKTTTTMALPAFVTPAMWTLRIVAEGDQLHLIYADLDGFFAYRNGLEPASADEGVSALACENTSREPNGWEPILKQNGYLPCDQAVCDKDGLLLNTGTGELTRRDRSGKWSSVKGELPANPFSSPQLMVDSVEKKAYLLVESGEVYEVDRDTLKPTQFRVQDVYGRYLARWIWLGLSLIAAWLLHYLIMTLGTSLLLWGAHSTEYHFGNQRVRLASLQRRGAASAIDVILLSSLIGFSIWGHSSVAGLSQKPFSRANLVQSLANMEDMMMYDPSMGVLNVVDALASIFLPFGIFELDESGGITVPGLMILIAVLLDTAVVLWSFKVFDEGRYGLTPGKWLFGIRTVRSTLRPCGFARALVRDIMTSIDLLALVTPIPAATSLVFSSTRQRLGDRVADTIVITAKSRSAAANPEALRSKAESNVSTVPVPQSPVEAL